MTVEPLPENPSHDPGRPGDNPLFPVDPERGAPVPTLLEVIQAESALTAMVNQSGGPNCKGITDWLNDSSHGDTETVPRTMKVIEMFGVVTAESAKKVFDHVNFNQLRIAVNAQDRVSVTEWIEGFTGLGYITQTEAGTLFAYMAGTEQKPVSRAWKQLGRVVNVQEVYHALTGN